MRIKNIEARLYKKITDWTTTLPDPLRTAVNRNALIAGGAIASLLKGQEPKDYDVYIQDGDVLKDLIVHYLAQFADDPPSRFANGQAVGIRLSKIEDDPAYSQWYDEQPPEMHDQLQATQCRYRVFIQSAGVASSEEEQPIYQYFEQTTEVRSTLYMQDLRSGSTDDNEKPSMKALREQNERDMLCDEQISEDPEEDPEEIEVGAASKRGLLRDQYVPVFMTDNCISLSGGVQLVLRFHGPITYILDSFDFLHTKQHYSLIDGLVLNQPALESLMSNELRYKGSYYPVCSMFRLRKFLARGMTVSAGTMFQIALDISKLDLTDIRVLYEQLIGVDAAYFMDFLNKLAAAKLNEDFTFDHSYLMALVDEVFNEAAERDAAELEDPTHDDP